MNFLLILFLLLSYNSQASLLTTFGLGAKNQALVNSGSSVFLDVYSQSYNPALLSLVTKREFAASMQGGFTFFESINQVLTDTTTLGGTSNVISNVSTKTPDTFSFSVSYAQPINQKFSFGLFLNSPVEKILGIDTQDSFLPQYSMYLSDTQRFSGGANLSYKLNDDLFLGIGGQLYLVTAATTRFRLPAGGNSTSRLRMDVRPGFAPIIGVTKVFDKIKASVIYWGKQDYNVLLENNTTLSLIAPTDLIFTVNSSVAFDPETFILSSSYQDDKNIFSLSAHIERWSQFSGSSARLNFTTFSGTFAQTQPSLQFKDVISLRAGFEHKYLNWALRFGYGFLPTPVPDQNGDSNYVDADKHALGIGASLFKGLLDIAMQAHYLTPKQIVKTSSQSIGYPGYKIGGLVLSYGLTWSTEL
ncbi:MAG: outer membrane protein transport protein [Oligoflexia bacterium]|nr:outer membrane protein transport protein [Oligoflexia bacterium]